MTPGQLRRTVTIAHRGAAGVAPENTLAAVSAGVAARPDFVEIDVQLTADDVPVLLHDTTLQRTTNVDEVFPDRAGAPLGAFTYDEVRRLDAGSWFALAFSGEPVPAFADILDVLPPEVGVFIELKHPSLSPGLGEVVADHLTRDPRWSSLVAGGKAWALSFDQPALREFHSRRPDIAVMPLGAVPHDDDVLKDIASWARAWGTDHRTVNPADIDRVQAAGLAFGAYTVNGSASVDDLIGLGVDMITSDFPDLIHTIGTRPYGDVRCAT